MSIANVLTGLTNAMEETKAELARSNARLDELEAERRSVAMAAPHADDIAAAFRRGLGGMATAFRSQLAAHLGATYAGEKAAEAATRSPQMLTIETHAPSMEERQTRAMRGATPDLNVAAVAYFLRDKIDAEIPGLVASTFPASQHGMKEAERQAILARLDGEIAEQRDKVQTLTADLAAVRAAVRQ